MRRYAYGTGAGEVLPGQDHHELPGLPHRQDVGSTEIPEESGCPHLQGADPWP